MSKEKRTYHAEVITSSSLQLQSADSMNEKNQNRNDHKVAKRQFFSPEMIARLAERIKKI